MYVPIVENSEIKLMPANNESKQYGLLFLNDNLDFIIRVKEETWFTNKSQTAPTGSYFRLSLWESCFVSFFQSYIMCAMDSVSDGNVRTNALS